MPSSLTLPYGSWPSPITAELIAADAIGLSSVLLDDDAVYWSELRGAEGGRNAIVRHTPAGVQEILPPPYSARSRVNEYGGGAFAVAEGTVYFVNNADQRIYRVRSDAAPAPITPSDTRRYGDLIVDRICQRVIAVCENHIAGAEPVQSIVAIDVSGATPSATLVSGRDFYAAPRISSDGRWFAFLAWDHPNMPWDGTDLHLAALDESGTIERITHVAGGREESIVQPAFAPDGTLYFVSDRSDWWNLYRYRAGAIEALLPRAAEFGGPQWVFGLSNYAFASNGRIVCAYNEQGMWRLGLLNSATGTWRELAAPYTDISYVQAHGERVVFIGAGPTTFPAVVAFDLATECNEIIRSSVSTRIDVGCLSAAKAIEYETAGGEHAHGFFYRPQNADVIAAANERPPLIVMSHGGPTSATSSALNLKIQYWTSRGFAVLDVNYRGSTGYGRAYRRSLDGAWGIADVDDCIAGARYLAASGDVDESRLAIRGGSAGGFTTLCALTFHCVFRAGASHYGISDLELLAADTHKFESRYLERLIGPYPQERERYRKRSPIHHADRLNCPVIFFQGAEDRVVPPNQTQRLVDALQARKIPVGYVLFPGEQHGFRRAENVRRVLETELVFYGRVFGFATDADRVVADPFL